MSDQDNLFEDMGMFEAAAHAQHMDLESPSLEVICVVTDGSNQDDSVLAFGRALADRTGAKVEQTHSALDAKAVLNACNGCRADLLVAPVPFGRDISVLKDESLGSVIDMLLLESKCPVFCVREKMSENEAPAALADVVLPVDIHAEQYSRAAGWAFSILAKSGELEMLAVADQDVIDRARDLLGDKMDDKAFQIEALNREITHDIGGLIAAVQKRGVAEGVDVHVEVKIGRPARVVLSEANARPRLVVAGIVKDHTAPSYHYATDIILGAKGPVLVV